MKVSLEVEHTEHDAIIASQIRAAQFDVENFMGETILDTEWTLTQEDFEDRITLKWGPVTSVSEVKYMNESNVETTLVEGTDYLVTEGLADTQIVMLEIPSTYDRPDAVRVVFNTGISGSDSRMLEAVRSEVARMYDNPMNEDVDPKKVSRLELYLGKSRRKWY